MAIMAAIGRVLVVALVGVAVKVEDGAVHLDMAHPVTTHFLCVDAVTYYLCVFFVQQEAIRGVETMTTDTVAEV